MINFLEYKTLEEAIVELWASREMDVLTEEVRVLKNGNVQWTIIAKRKKLSKDAESSNGRMTGPEPVNLGSNPSSAAKGL